MVLIPASMTMIESTPIYDQMVKEMTGAFTRTEAAKHTFGYVPKFMARDFPETTYLTGQDNWRNE